jgi:cobalt-zinc-cadmium efflux system outer membrane protein
MVIKTKTLLLSFFLAVSAPTPSGFAGELTVPGQRRDPFPSTRELATSLYDSLTLRQVLGLVADVNPSLKAGLMQIEAAEGLLIQAGLRPNPELEVEFEEVGWDAPGLKESEITVLLSQELELWGKRKNRRLVSQRELESTRLDASAAAFDVYATTVRRYFTLAHAQEKVALAHDATDWAEAITATARTRVEMGAAMSSELLLGQLLMETTRLQLADAMTNLNNARTELVSLWKAEVSDIAVTGHDLDFRVISKLADLQPLVDSSWEIRFLDAEAAVTDAQIRLQRSRARPNLSISGGYKRLEVDGSNTFVFGVGLPLPFMNRNQGNVASLRARTEAIRFSRQQALLTAKSGFEVTLRQIQQQVSRFQTIDTLILPKANEAFLSLKTAYVKGRLPYSTLLEAQRMLIDLRFELNDIDLTIKQEVASLERLLGVTIH